MKKIIAIGGGEIEGWSFKTKDDKQKLYQTESIDKEVVRLSQKSNPKLLFIGTASRENPIYFTAIKNIYEKLGCIVEPLIILEENVNIEAIKQKVLSSDIIYIGGGNTKFMLNEWKKVHLNDILLEAYNKGIVMSGFSAGCYCWFKYNYELIEGLDIIQAISCVHYNEKDETKRKEFYDTIKNNNMVGIALDNGTAIEYIDNKFKIIKSIKGANVYKITYINDRYITEKLKEEIEYKLI